ncbi:efflux transporter outer membrane subunit [Mariprofundus sp. NF]|uniref:efflux transporter outer membrane subunit n=1 Tax=Mariprofundus sp. NF TaxID=2608716 RepID=UPI0015A390D6|nr:efflux transporter outer membrane subunit [Mariprofundus sp. NF]NWF38694.1 efflux transporter outer membrane subunit [Mariprofundus sp. NF]
MKPLLLCLISMLISACVVGPDYQKPEFSYNDQWQGKSIDDQNLHSPTSEQWWEQFEDPLLTELITHSLQHNRDLAVAFANIERARASRRSSRSGLFPTLDAGGTASRNRYSSQTAFATNSRIRNSFSASLDASWELDLFGRTRRAIEADEAMIGAVEAARHGVKLSVVAEVAGNYFELRGVQRQLAMSRRSIALLAEVEDIVRAQFEQGVTSELDLLRARGERESMQANIPNLKADMMARIYRISVLTGQAPEFYVAKLSEQKALPLIRDSVPVGLRSEVLKRRPDVYQAERELAAATAGIGIAQADLFPSFSLTGSVGSGARRFSDLFTPATLTRSLAGLLNWPLFAGGALHAAVDVAKADEKIALARYEQSLLLALEDSENALMRYAHGWQRLKQLRLAEKSRQQAFEIAKLRFEAGEEDFMVILDAERSLITTQTDIINSEVYLLSSLSQLYKALGGGWSSEQP